MFLQLVGMIGHFSGANVITCSQRITVICSPFSLLDSIDSPQLLAFYGWCHRPKLFPTGSAATGRSSTSGRGSLMGQTNEKPTAEFHVVRQGKHTGRHDLIHFLKTPGAGIYQPEDEATNFVQNSSGLGFCFFFFLVILYLLFG